MGTANRPMQILTNPETNACYHTGTNQIPLYPIRVSSMS